MTWFLPIPNSETSRILERTGEKWAGFFKYNLNTPPKKEPSFIFFVFGLLRMTYKVKSCDVKRAKKLGMKSFKIF